MKVKPFHFSISKANSAFTFFFIVQTVFLFWSSFRPVRGRFEFRQAQTLWPVKIWQVEGFAPFQPAVPVKGISQQYWLLEFPLFQWIIYVLGTATRLNIDYVARITALVLALLIILIITIEINKRYPDNFALFLILFTFNPYFYYWSTTGLVDWLALFLGVVSGKLLILGLKNNKNTLLVLTGILLTLGFLVKISHTFFGLIFMILLFYLIEPENSLFKNNNKKRFWALSTFLLSLLPFLIWSNLIGNLYQKNDSRSIWATSKTNLFWYFGSLEQYQQFMTYLSLVFERYLVSVTNYSFFIFLLIFVFFFIKRPIVLLGFILLSFFYVFFLINLNYVHDYYQIPLLLVSGLILVLSVVNIQEKLRNKPANFFSIILVSLLFVSFSSFSTDLGRLHYGNLFLKSKNISNCPNLIPNSEPIFTLRVEDPALLYHCNLKSFMVVEGRKSDERNFAKERFLYNYVFIEDPNEIVRVNNFLNKYGGSVSSEVEPRWYHIEWR